MLDTGISRYFFTGGRDLLILVNGRPYATTAHNPDSLPLSAVERIEVLRAEGLGTIGGHAAVRGAFNLVPREDPAASTCARSPGCRAATAVTPARAASYGTTRSAPADG